MSQRYRVQWKEGSNLFSALATMVGPGIPTLFLIGDILTIPAQMSSWFLCLSVSSIGRKAFADEGLLEINSSSLSSFFLLALQELLR